MANETKQRRTGVRLDMRLALGLLAAALLIIGLVAALRPGRSGPEPAPEVSDSVPAAAAEVTPVPAPEPTPEPRPAPPEVDLDSWELRLVRRDSPLPADFAPELEEIEEGQMFDNRAVMHLRKLIADARAAGYSVYVCSGYRSYDTQSFIYWNHVQDYEKQGMTREEAEAATAIAVNYPGGSEHQLGLAADILEYQGQAMEPWIGGSGLMLWLQEHCADYGFVVRYPEGKTDVTGVEYEPWHLRFVGSCAWYLMEYDLCLEEFRALYQ